MFDTVFGDDALPEQAIALPPDAPEEEETEPEIVVPTFSQEELEATRKEGFQAGREEGQNASLDSIERQVAATLGNLESEIGKLLDAQKTANEEASHLALSVAISIAKKMLPEMAARNALEEIETVIRNVLPQIIEEPRITIHVHEDVESEITSRVDALATSRGYQGELNVHGDRELEIGDCRLEWSCGGADRNTPALWQEIDTIITRNLDKELAVEPEQSDVPDPAPEESLAEAAEVTPNMPDASEAVEPVDEEMNTEIPQDTPEASEAAEPVDEEMNTEIPQDTPEASEAAEPIDEKTNPELPPTTDV